MIFSEFGRRAPENTSLGTDHGAANNMFVVGKKVKGGHYGELPSLTNAVKSFFTPPATTLFHGVPLLFTTYGATAQPWETECCGVPPGHTMWVRYHARLAEPTRVTTEGSTFNTVLGVYTWNKSPDAAPVLVGCNDNGGYDGQTSRLFFNPAPLTDYYIMVDGVGGAPNTWASTSTAG